MINNISLDNDTFMMTLTICQLSLLELLTRLECVHVCAFIGKNMCACIYGSVYVYTVLIYEKIVQCF